MTDRGPWIPTYTGKRFFPLDPRPEDICIKDIAHALSHIGRFGGHTREFYSVAQHSVLVSLHVSQDWSRQGLLHDAAEAYVGDVVAPLKPGTYFFTHSHNSEGPLFYFTTVEDRIQFAISQAFDVYGLQESTHPMVSEIDKRLCLTEANLLMADGTEGWPLADEYEPLGVTFDPLPPKEAETLFLARWEELTREREAA